MVVKWELGSYLDAAIDIYTHLKIQIMCLFRVIWWTREDHGGEG